MEALYKLQHNNRIRIEKAQINFKKTPKDRISRPYVETRLEALENLWKEFMSTHRSILLNDAQDDSDKYFCNDVYDSTEEMYIIYKAQLKEILNTFSHNQSDKNSKTNVDHAVSNVRLPKINISKFSGNYTEWTTFKDLFTSLIHNNDCLEDVQKMHYLKGLLSGEAEQLVRHIAVSSDNYNECWSLLHSRYNNVKFLSNGYLKRLLGQNNVNECSSSIKGLLDTTMECLNGLKNLGIDVSTWDSIVIFIVSSKLDPESRKQWETKISNKDELPVLSEFREFLEARFRALEFVDTKSSKPKPKVHHVVTTDNKAVENCPFCKENHKISSCKKFAQESYESRHSFAQTRRLCYNCLNANHSIKFCRHTATCRICKKRHHSLLHPNSVSNSTVVRENSNTADEVKSAVSNVQASLSVSEPLTSNSIVSHFSKGSIPTQVLLATALVEAQTRSGSTQLLRVLLDQGSQASFIAESAVQLLGLKKKPVKSVISGIGGERSAFASKFTVTVTIHSRLNPQFSVQVHAFVLGTITSVLPSEKLEQAHWPQLKEITLADPEFHTPSKIDILLGAEIYSQVLRDGLIHGPPNSPVAQNTAFGWILSGQISSNPDSIHCHHVIQSSSDQADENALLRQFWEIESSIPDKKILSDEEQRCEDIYAQTTYRDQEGRYVVNLPFRDQDPQCKYGGSRDLAIKRFHLLENKFKKNPSIKARYSDVFKEYIDLGHMEPVHSDERNMSTAVYLAHHAVVREDKVTSKVRIVFDASMKGSNGVSLNDDLMVGPMLQPPLRHIIMRWRMHPISLCADIIKMYRQVKVSPEHAEFQRVVWRDDPESEIKEYKLVRVTFGTAAAPYLAVKSLQQVAVDTCESLPEIAEIIKNEFYVDDLMSGCQTVEEGLHIHRKLTDVLTKGRFQLQKWVSSCDELNEKFQENEGTKIGQEREEEKEKNIKLDSVIKILGISWDRESDLFKYSVQLEPQQTPITKRKVISDITRLFDPLGWMAPCIITSKIFIQKLWLAGLEWDEELTPELLSEWETYRLSLVEMNKFSIPRWIKTKSDDRLVELHGFCDASIAAYAAVVYIRVIDADNFIHVNLVTSRTRVAPIKQQSVPRLELMGAVLLSELISEVAEVLKITPSQIHAWTDSSVVLAWLSKHPSHWTTFVGNRVSTILSCVDNSHWAHVQSAHNPADLASRGVTPQELVSSSLWSKGPAWLHEDTIEYTRPKSITTNTEQRSVKVHVITEPHQGDLFWTKYSSLTRFIRVIAYCRRVLSWKKHTHGKKRYERYLTKEEIEEATKTCIRLVQSQEFFEEIQDIRKTGSVKTRSKLKSVCPVIDDEGILRVSGRIQNAHLDESIKHPIILPSDSHFTYLVIDEAHKKTLHGGPTLMLSHLRTKYWIPSARTKVKGYVHKCVKCKRYSASIQTPLMGQLPTSRVTPARPFLNSGVDFAGPISMRTSKGRGHQAYKGYICVFVCMVTKAIHLEAVSDLTSQGFIAGFKRFVSRRGFVSNIWSDNGTNFVGAAKELRHLVAAEQSSVAVEIREWLGNNSTSWHFIPPHSPNFGGLWEAGVKSTKFHLRRVIGNSTLTFEEMSTLLSQIEACLNSRPLSMLPDNSMDPVPLTPGHFLIGEPLIAVPERNYESSNISNLRRWQVTQRMLQDFWRRWSNEYLVHLLQRYKWTKNVPEPGIGDVVLVKEDNLPPARWLLGKVVEKHPGLDKVTRVVTLKCNGSLIKRPISKLCILPIAK